VSPGSSSDADDDSSTDPQLLSVALETLFPAPIELPRISEFWTMSKSVVPPFLLCSATSNVMVQGPVDLELAQDTLPLHMIYGLDELKHLLTTRIGIPASQPEKFSFNGTHKAPIQHNFFFFGRHGTGKRTLVRSFCKTVGLTLCEAFGPGFNPAQELATLYEQACNQAPAIVLFNDCDAQFMKNSPNVATLWRILKDVRARGLPVWTIFRSQFKQDILDPLLQDQLAYSMWSAVPTPIDRERLWCTAFLRYSRREHLPSVHELRMLCEVSEHCVARNIFNFVEHCVAEKLAHLGYSLASYSTDDPHLELRLDDLKFISIDGVRHITRSNPQEENVTMYIVPVRADNPQFNPHGRAPKAGNWH